MYVNALMAPASRPWTGALGSGICAVAIRHRDYTGLQGLFHNFRIITTGLIRTYDESHPFLLDLGVSRLSSFITQTGNYSKSFFPQSVEIPSVEYLTVSPAWPCCQQRVD